jgi:hypothetical protein
MRRQSQFDGSRGHRLTAFLPIAKRIRALLRGLKCQVAQNDGLAIASQQRRIRLSEMQWMAILDDLSE